MAYYLHLWPIIYIQHNINSVTRKFKPYRYVRHTVCGISLKLKTPCTAFIDLKQSQRKFELLDTFRFPMLRMRGSVKN